MKIGILKIISLVLIFCSPIAGLYLFKNNKVVEGLVLYIISSFIISCLLSKKIFIKHVNLMLLFFYFFIFLFNFLGYDDKNIILGSLSPIFWFMDAIVFFTGTSHIAFYCVFLSDIIFALLFGIIINYVVKFFQGKFQSKADS